MMRRKFLLPCLSLLAILVIVFNVYKLLILNEFKDYLNSNYSTYTFHVSWVKFDPIYEKFYAPVKCIEDDIEFGIFSNATGISDNFYNTKNQNALNLVVLPLKNKTDNNIRSITAGSSKFSKIDSTSLLNYNESIDSIFVYYHDKSFDNNVDFAAKSLDIIEQLHGLSVYPDTIHYTQERDGSIFVLQLKSQDLNSPVHDITNLIIKHK